MKMRGISFAIQRTWIRIFDSRVIRARIIRSARKSVAGGSFRIESKSPILSPGIPFWFERGLFTHSDSISKNSARTPLEERETHYRTSTKAILLFM